MKTKDFLFSLCLMATFSAPACADDGSAFFKGKVVDYIVATSPGGVYDTNGRLVAEYMQKHLPGSTFVVRNMAGAGGMIGANYIYASEPDGLTLGSFNTGLIYAQLSENPALKFDLETMGWVGKLTSDPRVIVVSKDSGITSFEDLAKAEKRVKFATCGVGCSSMVESTLLVSSFDLPVQVISGYNGNEGQLAMMRGEVVGTLGSRSEFEKFVAEGHGRFIAQIGGTQTDVPQLADFTADDDARAAVELIAALGQLGRWTAIAPGVPADRLSALQDAYVMAVSDPEFIEKAKRIDLPVDPMPGDRVGALVEAALNQTPEVVQLLKTATETH